jgi:hypothetical protein
LPYSVMLSENGPHSVPNKSDAHEMPLKISWYYIAPLQVAEQRSTSKILRRTRSL